MNFFKSFLASLTAIIVAGLLLFFVFFGVLIAIVSGGKKEVVIKDNSILQISLEGQIVENAPPSEDDLNFDLSKILPGAPNAKKMGLYQITESIRQAKDDDRIRGIYFTPGATIATGNASLRTIYRALVDFKASGKFIYTYTEVLTEKPYYLASVSDAIYLPPSGFMEFNGFVANPMYFTGLMEKLEIEPQIFRVGTYKSAIEPFFRKDMSDASREQTSVYLNVLWEEYLEDVAAGRKMDVAQLNTLAEEFVIGDGKKALDKGLIDELVYENEVHNRLKKSIGMGEDDDLNFVKLSAYIKAPSTKPNTSRDRIAIVFAEGEINSGESTDGNMGSETIVKALRQARKDKNVKAVVLRVNSPGGSALASDMMAEEVRLTAETKPIICSMGDVAASGGYYIAAHADKIFADENTITGSIGIFGLFFTTNKMFNNKLGITFDQVETHDHANFGNPNFPLTPAEEQMFQTQINKGYGEFLEVVREGRSTFFADSAAVDKVGQGRVWPGRIAKEKYLVDEFGGLEEALAAAAEAANLDTYRVRLLPKAKSSIELIMEAMEEAKIRIDHPFSEEMEALTRIKQIMKQGGVMARMPYDVVVE